MRLKNADLRLDRPEWFENVGEERTMNLIDYSIYSVFDSPARRADYLCAISKSDINPESAEFPGIYLFRAFLLDSRCINKRFSSINQVYNVWQFSEVLKIRLLLCYLLLLYIKKFGVWDFNLDFFFLYFYLNPYWIQSFRIVNYLLSTPLGLNKVWRVVVDGGLKFLVNPLPNYPYL